MSTETTTLKRLPAGIHSFSKLRRGDRLYVDKTADILRFVSDYEAVFLSRPRRFGKSLLVSTLEELFKGNKSLFQGLAIYDQWDWEQKHPVVRIDWSRYKYSSLVDLDNQLMLHFQDIAEDYEIELKAKTLDELVEKLHKKTGQEVVVLIDEYDALMLDAIADAEKLENAKAYLHSVYRGLKAVGEHIRFLFLTGVSKFAGLSIFSGLNNLSDITLNKEFSTICGCTQGELENNFSEYIDMMAARKFNSNRAALLEEVKKWYNGYSWDGETSLYNPFSILRFFEEKEFENFWCETGTPTFLVKTIQMRNDVSEVIRPLRVAELRGGGATNINDIPFEQLLFQTGYLTIKKIERLSSTSKEYILDFPNSEVQKSFLGVLLTAYFDQKQSVQENLTKKLSQQLQAADAAGIEESLKTMLAWVPFSIIKGEKEGYYHALMLLWLRVLGFDVQGELPTNRGIIDAVWTLPDQIIIIEVKFNKSVSKKEKLLDEALAQIHSHGYAERYLNFSGRISLLGVAFAGGKVGCRLEILKEGAKAG